MASHGVGDDLFFVFLHPISTMLYFMSLSVCSFSQQFPETAYVPLVPSRDLEENADSPFIRLQAAETAGERVYIKLDTHQWAATTYSMMLQTISIR